MINRIHYNIIIFFVVFAMQFFYCSVKGQSNFFDSYRPVNHEENKNLYFRFESTSFFQNNEYFNPFAYGIIGIGFYLKPGFEYYFTPRLRVNGGLYLIKYAGSNGFTQVTPVFSVQYEIGKSLDVVFGNIYGSTNHHLEQPIFRFERYYTNHIENGLQFLFHSERFTSDLWLNWEHFIFIGDTLQEQFIFGNSSVASLFSSNNWSVKLPFQLLIEHHGGQLSPIHHRMYETLNAMSGIIIGFEFDEKINLIFQQLYFVYNGLVLPNEGAPGYQPFKKGYGLYSKIRYSNRWFGIMAGYWYGNKFIAPQGEYLFQSVSEKPANYSEPIRKLWVMKVSYEKQIYQDIKLSVRFSSYYDLINSNMDYSYSFYFIINQDFFLIKNKH